MWHKIGWVLGRELFGLTLLALLASFYAVWALQQYHNTYGYRPDDELEFVEKLFLAARDVILHIVGVLVAAYWIGRFLLGLR